jgi:hypothetical protein
VFHGCNNTVCISMQCRWGSFGVAIIGPGSSSDRVRHDHQSRS